MIRCGLSLTSAGAGCATLVCVYKGCSISRAFASAISQSVVQAATRTDLPSRIPRIHFGQRQRLQKSIRFFGAVGLVPSVNKKMHEDREKGKAQPQLGQTAVQNGTGKKRQAVSAGNKRVNHGGASRDRTDGLIVANDALSQLSYSPTMYKVQF